MLGNHRRWATSIVALIRQKPLRPYIPMTSNAGEQAIELGLHSTAAFQTFRSRKTGEQRHPRDYRQWQTSSWLSHSHQEKRSLPTLRTQLSFSCNSPVFDYNLS